jgi:hypothetical protein
MTRLATATTHAPARVGIHRSSEHWNGTPRMDTLKGMVSTDSDRNPESSPRLGAQRGVAITESVSAERATSPEFAQRMRTAVEPTLTADAADRSADSIRPSWEEPSFRMLRPRAVHHLSARELAPRHDLAGDDANIASALPPLLTADEADGYAARIQPSWAPPPGWSAAPSMPVMPMMPVVRDQPIEQPDGHRVESDRTSVPVLRAALIVSGFALLGAAAGALLALAPRPGSSVPAVETKVSALTAETVPPGDPPSLQTPPTAASSDTVRVRIAAEPARAKIFLDGVEVPNPFDARRLKGGRHRVLVRARGRATRDLTLTFERDEYVRISLPSARD